MAFDPDRLDQRDPRTIRALTVIAKQLNSRYLRLQCEGLEHVRAVKNEAALFVSNHNGGISGPDLSCTLGTLWETLGPETPLYALAHDFVMRQMTPVGRFLQRVGAVRASPENAQRILESGGKALVYPGGDLEAYRHSRHRDRIVLGERTGFIRLVQKTQSPIVPIVAQGAHRSAFILSDGEVIARKLRLQRWGRVARFPIALALPWGIALGPWLPYLPLPFPIRLRALPPMHFSRDEDPIRAREKVRSTMQAALDDMSRKPVN